MRALSMALSMAALARLQVHARRTMETDLLHASLEQVAANEAGGEVAARTNSSYLRKDYSFCINGEGELHCDEFSVIRVVTAMYNRRKRGPNKMSCEPSNDGQEEGCDLNNFEMVHAKCGGYTSCQIQPEDHWSCEESGFTFMRVVFECEATPPHVDEHHEEGDGANDPPSIKVMAPDLRNQGLGAEDDQGVETPLKEMMDDTKPVVVKGTKGGKVVKAIKAEDREDIEITFKPCYRMDRFSKIYNIFSTGIHEATLGRLTGCGAYEGCFKVLFKKDGEEFWYTDENAAPTPQEVYAGELVYTTDWKEWLVSFQGLTGLRRSDYWSWGICLPKTEGVQNAIERWDDLKALQAAIDAQELE